MMIAAQPTRETSPKNSTIAPVYAKYGEASVAGFQAVPDILLKHQGDLGLSPTGLVVLLNVLMHWWYPEQKPFPRSTTIAKRMKVTPRTVQRAFQDLEDLKLLAREKDTNGSVYFNPAPLVEKLVSLAKTDTDYLIRRERRDGEEGLSPTSALRR